MAERKKRHESTFLNFIYWDWSLSNASVKCTNANERNIISFRFIYSFFFSKSIHKHRKKPIKKLNLKETRHETVIIVDFLVKRPSQIISYTYIYIDDGEEEKGKLNEEKSTLYSPCRRRHFSFNIHNSSRKTWRKKMWEHGH